MAEVASSKRKSSGQPGNTNPKSNIKRNTVESVENESLDWEDEDPCAVVYSHPRRGYEEGSGEEEGYGSEDEEGSDQMEVTDNEADQDVPKPHKCRKVRKTVPWYIAAKKKTELEKRQDSAIAFIMPRQEDAKVLALRKTNKMVEKLMKYMKKSWKVRIDRKQADRELEYRTLSSVHTKKPENWDEILKARDTRALETGFFTTNGTSYKPLIDLELDSALLTFKNLPPDLKITAGRWIRIKLRKEELKRKRDALLPRVPHGKVQRPSYNKGRLLKDAGGVNKVDQFVRVAEGFVRVTNGNTTFSKVLKDWSQKKEKESFGLNSGFGVVREGLFDFSSKNRVSNPQDEEDDNTQKNNSDQRRVSIVDARKYQRDMLYFEKMLSAMFDVVKSVLNIKKKQLESKFPLPPSAVLHIRATSPEKTISKKAIPFLILQRQAMVAHRQSVANNRAISKKSVAVFNVIKKASKAIKKLSDDVDHNPSHLHSHGDMLYKNPLAETHVDVRKSLANIAAKDTRRKSEGSSMMTQQLEVVGIEATTANDVINLSPPRSTNVLVKDIKKQHSFEDFVDLKNRKQTMITEEQKIKRLAENPEHASIRRARNTMTYTKLFERNRKVRRPVWHSIDVAEIAAQYSQTSGILGKDPANLTDGDAAEIAEMALKKRQTESMRTTNAGLGGEDEEVNKRWPEEYDIPTPTYQFPGSKVKIPSEEQSRLNLLKKTPHIDEVPSTPVRRLYKLAGVRTVEKDIFNNVMSMKKMFRLTENKVRVYCENEIGKLDWDTHKRFQGKLNGIKPGPIFQWAISVMRLNHEHAGLAPSSSTKKDEGSEDRSEDDQIQAQRKLSQKRPALWYKKLQEESEINGATRHHGCQTELQKLLRYCDVDMKTKPHMLNRLALLVVSLPTTELGAKHWQQAVMFLLEFMCGTPPELIHVWLKYRGIPYLL